MIRGFTPTPASNELMKLARRNGYSACEAFIAMVDARALHRPPRGRPYLRKDTGAMPWLANMGKKKGQAA